MEYDSGPVLRRLGTRDISRAAHVLADAFVDDPFYTWVLPGSTVGRRRGLTRLFKTALSLVYVPEGSSTLSATRKEQIMGVALWEGPGHETGGLISMLQQRAQRWALGDRSRFYREGAHQLHAARPTEQHWYLSCLGTTEESRGGGFGRALLEDGLRRADEDGVGAHLESSKEANIGLYERFGFTVTGECVMPEGPTLYLMWRAPQP